VGLPGGGDDEAVAAAEGGGPRGGEAGAQRRHVTMMGLPAYSTNGDGDACLYEQLCLGEPLRGYKRSGLVGATHLPETEEAEPNRQSFVIRSAAKIGSRRATDISAARRAFVGCLGEYFFFVWYWLVATETNDRRYVVFYPAAAAGAASVPAFPRCRGVDARVGEGCLPRAVIRKMDRNSIRIFAVAPAAFLIFVHPLESDVPHTESWPGFGECYRHDELLALALPLFMRSQTIAKKNW
jgi:hypothetical protein